MKVDNEEESESKPLDRLAEEIQAGYNSLAQAHCCKYHVAIKSIQIY